MIWERARKSFAAQKGMDPAVLEDWHARELVTATSTIGAQTGPRTVPALADGPHRRSGAV